MCSWYLQRSKSRHPFLLSFFYFKGFGGPRSFNLAIFCFVLCVFQKSIPFVDEGTANPSCYAEYCLEICHLLCFDSLTDSR